MVYDGRRKHNRREKEITASLNWPLLFEPPPGNASRSLYNYNVPQDLGVLGLLRGVISFHPQALLQHTELTPIFFQG